MSAQIIALFPEPSAPEPALPTPTDRQQARLFVQLHRDMVDLPAEVLEVVGHLLQLREARPVAFDHIAETVAFHLRTA